MSIFSRTEHSVQRLPRSYWFNYFLPLFLVPAFFWIYQGMPIWIYPLYFVLLLAATVGWAAILKPEVPTPSPETRKKALTIAAFNAVALIMLAVVLYIL